MYWRRPQNCWPDRKKWKRSRQLGHEPCFSPNQQVFYKHSLRSIELATADITSGQPLKSHQGGRQLSHQIIRKNLTHTSAHVPLYTIKKRKKRNEAEWAGKAEISTREADIRKTEFLPVGEACKAVCRGRCDPFHSTNKENSGFRASGCEKDNNLDIRRRKQRVVPVWWTWCTAQTPHQVTNERACLGTCPWKYCRSNRHAFVQRSVWHRWGIVFAAAEALWKLLSRRVHLSAWGFIVKGNTRSKDSRPTSAAEIG